MPASSDDNAGDEPATAEQLAAFEFEPFSPEDVANMMRDFSRPKWAKEFGQHGVALRLASVFLRLTKQEMVAGVEHMEQDFSGDGTGPTAEFLDCMRATRERLRELADLLQAAEIRQLSAASVVELKLTEGDAA